MNPNHTPTPVTERSVAPDLARGSALLGIALANSVYYITASRYGARSRPLGGSALDNAVDLILVTLVDARWLPLFAALFGYGVVQMTRRQAAPDRGRSVVRRHRFAWLVAFGAVHVLLLFGGDILAIYGLLGFVLLAMLRARDRLLLVVAGLVLLLAVPLAALVGMPPLGSATRSSIPSLLTTDPWEALLLRVAAWPLDLVLLSLSALAPMLLGIHAARRRVLDEPHRHRRLLRRTALAGIPLGVAGGVPLGLIAAEVWAAGATTTFLFSCLHVLTGFAASLGAGAAFGLLATARRGPVVRALAATGRRSLSCYLAQSVVFVALFAPYAGGLGDDVGTAAMALVAALVWLATVAAATLAERTARRGPAEVLLRRLTYARSSRAFTRV